MANLGAPFLILGLLLGALLLASVSEARSKQVAQPMEVEEPNNVHKSIVVGPEKVRKLYGKGNKLSYNLVGKHWTKIIGTVENIVNKAGKVVKKTTWWGWLMGN